MSHKPTVLDAKSDIIRSITSTFSKDGLKDKNYRYFLKSALSTIERLDLDQKKKELLTKQINKSVRNKKDINKVREDLLLITSFI
jgi:hypothetical protein